MCELEDGRIATGLSQDMLFEVLRNVSGGSVIFSPSTTAYVPIPSGLGRRQLSEVMKHASLKERAKGFLHFGARRYQPVAIVSTYPSKAGGSTLLIEGDIGIYDAVKNRLIYAVSFCRFDQTSEQETYLDSLPSRVNTFMTSSPG